MEWKVNFCYSAEIMFTGIIKKTAKVSAVKKANGNLLVFVAKPTGWKIKEGESISVNGICSTVNEINSNTILFKYIPETLRNTTVGFWEKGENINLEKSLLVGDEIGGHIVTGHIEGIGNISAIVNEGGSRLFKIEAPGELFSRIVKKGSVAVDGISLTVADVGDDWFGVALIPYTLKHTNLRERQVGDKVNVETDILAKYAKKQKIKI